MEKSFATLVGRQAFSAAKLTVCISGAATNEVAVNVLKNTRVSITVKNLWAMLAGSKQPEMK